MGKIKSHLKSKSGFTFVEILVAVGVIGFALPIVFSIVFTIFRQQTKIYRLTEAKKQGDYILSLSKNLITSATGIYEDSALVTEKCDGIINNAYSTGGNSFYFKDKNSAAINIILSSGQIATGPSGIAMTNSNVEVNDYQISCVKSTIASEALVTLKFDIKYKTSSTNVEDATPELSYQSSYKLRN
jgi:type II secretory pathway pseudopilin PulG